MHIKAIMRETQKFQILTLEDEKILEVNSIHFVSQNVSKKLQLLSFLAVFLVFFEKRFHFQFTQDIIRENSGSD